MSLPDSDLNTSRYLTAARPKRRWLRFWCTMLYITKYYRVLKEFTWRSALATAMIGREITELKVMDVYRMEQMFTPKREELGLVGAFCTYPNSRFIARRLDKHMLISDILWNKLKGTHLDIGDIDSEYVYIQTCYTK